MPRSGRPTLWRRWGCSFWCIKGWTWIFTRSFCSEPTRTIFKTILWALDPQWEGERGEGGVLEYTVFIFVLVYFRLLLTRALRPYTMYIRMGMYSGVFYVLTTVPFLCCGLLTNIGSRTPSRLVTVWGSMRLSLAVISFSLCLCMCEGAVRVSQQALSRSAAMVSVGISKAVFWLAKAIQSLFRLAKAIYANILVHVIGHLLPDTLWRFRGVNYGKFDSTVKF